MSFILENIFLFAIAIISGALLAWPMLNRVRGVKGIDITTATRLVNQENAVFLDVRSTDAYAEGHIPQSRNIPVDALENRTQGLPKNKPIIVVCADGRTSGRAVALLQAKGFDKDKVYALTEGIGAWNKANLPLTKR